MHGVQRVNVLKKGLVGLVIVFENANHASRFKMILKCWTC